MTRRLRVVQDQWEPDREAAARAVSDLLVALGRDPADQHLADTPRRVADAYLELLSPRPFNLTTFPNDEGYDELVLARGIRSSRCASITSFPSMASRTSDISLAPGSWACRSSPASWSCSPGTCRSRSG